MIYNELNENLHKRDLGWDQLPKYDEKKQGWLKVAR
jgi:hypothetical protein